MSSVPVSVGFIIDGNRRFAKERGLPTLEGHRQGIEKLLTAIEWAQEAGCKETIFYIFSTENWNRSPEEVAYLMDLLTEFFKKSTKRLEETGVRVRILGDLSRASDEVVRTLREVEERTKRGTQHTAAFAFSYGGRTEILYAVNTLLEKKRERVSEKEFEDALYTAGLADPDLIIRTGGEMRLSNFLPWQGVYSELFFVDTKWPAFTKEEFQGILESFAARERRRGK
jgi:undecaprenyl diphosphate synthase